jgi:hypothetical protein
MQNCRKGRKKKERKLPGSRRKDVKKKAKRASMYVCMYVCMYVRGEP